MYRPMRVALLVLATADGCSSSAPEPATEPPPLGTVGEWRRIDGQAAFLWWRPHCGSTFAPTSQRRRLDCTPGGPRPLELRTNGSEVQDPVSGAWTKLIGGGAIWNADEAYALADGRAIVIRHSVDESETRMRGLEQDSRFRNTAIGIAGPGGIVRDLRLPFDTLILQPELRIERKAVVVLGGMLVTSKMRYAGGGCEHPPPGVGCDPAPPAYAYEQRSNAATWAMQLIP